MMLKSVWGEFRTPSKRNPDPHHRGATGIWHAALGAIPGLVLADYGGWPVFVTVPFLVAVYMYKELGDVFRGGSVSDSLEDAVFVAMGAIAAYFDALYGLITVNIAAIFVVSLQIQGNKKNG